MATGRIDHKYTNEVVCPYCGCEFMDSWEISSGDEDLGMQECGDCGKSFYATRNISITYSTVEARYGTCADCGAKDVPIEDQHSSYGSYKDLCVSCGSKCREQLIAEYMKQLDAHKAQGEDGHADNL